MSEKNNFQVSSELEHGQHMLIGCLRTVAQVFYDKNYQPYASSLGPLNFKPVARDTLPVHPEFAAGVTTWLLNHNVSDFADYKTGTTAQVLVGKATSGKVFAIRVPLNFDQPERHQRLDHPAVLQPLAVTEYGRGQNIEILPLVPCVGIKTDGMFQQYLWILKDVYQTAGLHVDGLRQDVGVLPDGTPTLVDPDATTFSGSTARRARGAEIVLGEFPAMKPVLWVRNGKPKQNEFFGGNYLSEPLPPSPKRRPGAKAQLKT